MFDRLTVKNFENLNFTAPRIHFGAGRIKEIPHLIQSSVKNILIVTGKHSFRSTKKFSRLLEELKAKNHSLYDMTVSGEPSPKTVDDAVGEFHKKNIHLVLAVGGGSVLDASKAIAGLLPYGNSVMDHLEGVGKGISYEGPALPFIAVPTTAGTGSEATKNAVLSMQGPDGFKKSFRHDTLVPMAAVVDPELLETCTSELIAANGMDAFTQLLESYVSIRANPFTDALAWSGLRAVISSLPEIFSEAESGNGIKNIEGLTSMAYGSLLSGITLAHAGLGSVHGLASPLGAFFPIPHGAVCGTLASRAAKENIDAMLKRDPENHSLRKYAEVGLLVSGKDAHDLKTEKSRLDVLIQILDRWTSDMKLKKLGAYGVKTGDLDKIVANSRGNSMQTNPIKLEDAEIRSILTDRL